MGVKLASPKLARAVLVLLALLLGAAGFDAARWWQARQLAARVPAVDSIAAADDEAPLLRFARAARLAERGDVDAALDLYRSLHRDPALGAAARYNGANLLLRQAMALGEAGNPGQALALVELAKQWLRDLLREQPDHWDARYNLERAQRLVPEPEEIDPPIGEPRNDAERAATTMRGVAPGPP